MDNENVMLEIFIEAIHCGLAAWPVGWLDLGEQQREQIGKRFAEHAAASTDLKFVAFRERLPRLFPAPREPQPPALTEYSSSASAPKKIPLYHYINPHELEWWKSPAMIRAMQAAAREAIAACPAFPLANHPRGVVVTGGGRYLPSAWVTINVLRHVGCTLPIELWHLADEIPAAVRPGLAALGVTCRDADAESLESGKEFSFSASWWRGWQLKAFALAHCGFEEVLALDADSYPVRNPEYLFDLPAYRQHGAIFWPDLADSSWTVPPQVYAVFGAEPLDGMTPTESGQMLVDRTRHSTAIWLARYYNEQSEFTYRWIYGDKDTFPIAWRRLGLTYARLWPTSIFDRVAIRQFNERGFTLFIHRCRDKFRLPDMDFQSSPQLTSGAPQRFTDFPLENFCHDALEEFSVRMKAE